MARTATPKIEKRIPSSETGAVLTCKTLSGEVYVISQNPLKEKTRFTLWKKTEDGYEKRGSAASPDDLEVLIYK